MCIRDSPPFVQRRLIGWAAEWANQATVEAALVTQGRTVQDLDFISYLRLIYTTLTAPLDSAQRAKFDEILNEPAVMEKGTVGAGDKRLSAMEAFRQRVAEQQAAMEASLVVEQ